MPSEGHVLEGYMVKEHQDQKKKKTKNKTKTTNKPKNSKREKSREGPLDGEGSEKSLAYDLIISCS